MAKSGGKGSKNRSSRRVGKAQSSRDPKATKGARSPAKQARKATARKPTTGSSTGKQRVAVSEPEQARSRSDRRGQAPRPPAPRAAAKGSSSTTGSSSSRAQGSSGRAERLARSRAKRARLSKPESVNELGKPAAAAPAAPAKKVRLATPRKTAPGEARPPAAARPPASPFSPEFLEVQKNRLLAKREELLARLRRGRESGIEAQDSPTEDLVDRANNAYVRELSTSLSDAERQILQEIEEALRRMEQGSYGLCAHSGRPIGRERLEALPWARLSIEAQERLERGLLPEA